MMDAAIRDGGARSRGDQVRRRGFEPTEPRSCPAVRRTSESRAAAGRGSRAMVGFYDALDFIDGQFSPPGQVGDAGTEGAALVIDGLAKGKSLADGDPFRILGLFRRADPA